MQDLAKGLALLIAIPLEVCLIVMAWRMIKAYIRGVRETNIKELEN